MLPASITGYCGKALMADCVPFDPLTKRPRAPARDMLIINYASVIPSLIIPAILGAAFTLFPSKAEGYKAFFLISAGIHFFSSILYLKVRPHPARVLQVIKTTPCCCNHSGHAPCRCSGARRSIGGRWRRPRKARRRRR